MEHEARQVLSILLDHGYQAYMVGGYVRDRICKRQIQDIDIATSATPEEVMRLFPHTAPTGLQHGTVTVMMNRHAFEVTTFRKESGYEDRRRPTMVQFIDDITEDLRRRDFTMNAMAIDMEGRLIDPFGGASDLRQGLLRCVGDAHIRFAEDALRMLRCIRFAANYEFVIDPNTWQAILANRALMKQISMERVRIELEKILSGSDPARGIRLLAESGIMDNLKINLSWPLEEILPFVAPLIKLNKDLLRWTVFFILLKRSPEDVKAALRQLTFPNKRIQRISRLVSFHWRLISDDNQETTELLWKRAAITYNKECANDWLELLSGYGSDLIRESNLDGHKLKEIRLKGQDWLHELTIETVRDLRIGGDDLLSLGKGPGPWIGELLNRLFYDAALGIVSNEKDALLNRAYSLIKGMN